jgi:putative SOS response-associated peptidase YedK
MCGRFTLIIEGPAIQLAFKLKDIPTPWAPRYNIAPSQPLAVIKDYQNPKIDWLNWGLVPHWAKDQKIGYKLINARAETVAEKPSFRGAFKHHHCLILADGFYEWQRFAKKSKRSIPHYFHFHDNKPFAFAGLWETWHSPHGDEVQTCTIITCDANQIVAPIHHRMPAILDMDTCWEWLKPKSRVEHQELLQPYPAARMHAYPVSTLVNSPANDLPECISPLAEA